MISSEPQANEASEIAYKNRRRIFKMDEGTLGQVRVPQGIFDQSVQRKADLGFKLPFRDGRVYVYSRAGEGLTMGQLAQAPAIAATLDRDLVIAVAGKAIDRQLALTILDAHSEFDANAYESGFVLIEEGTEQGLMRKIKSNDAFASTEDATVIFKFKDALKEAVAISGHYAKILACPYNGVLANVGTGKLVGVTPIDVTTDYYFWLLISGLGPAKNANGAEIAVGILLTDNGVGVKYVAGHNDTIVGESATYCASNTLSLMVYYKIE